MATYAIGDIQGCFVELQALLKEISFDAKTDTLWFAGDLVNRGPLSLEVLRFIKSLGEKHKTVLGNHDLHLMAVAMGVQDLQIDDTFEPILAAPDRHELIDWLRHRALFHSESGYVMVHAGLSSLWTIEKAQMCAKEVEHVLQSSSAKSFLQQMYGNEPSQWNEHLSGMERLRCITNYLTRMRFCYGDGRLEFSYKGKVGHAPTTIMPWFKVPHRQSQVAKIIFGHFAALGGETTVPNLYPLDTGCVWGNCLTAMRLEDAKRFSVKC